MLKKLISLIICIMIILSFGTISSQAFFPRAGLECDTFTKNWWNAEGRREALEAKGIYQDELCSFSDGLLKILQKIGDEEGKFQSNYVDLDGNLVDLNRGRYGHMMSPFSEGLAAVCTEEGDYFYGFIDTQGNEVLDLSMCHGTFFYTSYMTSKFVDGKTIVHNNYGTDLMDFEKIYENEKRDYAQSRREVPTSMPNVNEWTNDQMNDLPLYYIIDKAGNVLEIVPNFETLKNYPLFKDSICFWDGITVGQVMDFETTEPEKIPETNYLRPELPALEEAQTHFQSKAKVTSVITHDFDYGSFELTITNNTAYKDSGIIALVAANIDNSTYSFRNSAVYFTSYCLEPYSSEKVYIATVGILHHKMINETGWNPSATAESLKDKVEAAVVHFEDEEDLYSFYDIIPYEQNWVDPNNYPEIRPLCEGIAGIEFLKMVNINRPNCDADEKHNICRR